MNINKINNNHFEIQSTNNLIIKIINKNKIIVKTEKNVDFFILLKNKKISIDEKLFLEPFIYKDELITRAIKPKIVYNCIYINFCKANNQVYIKYGLF